MSVFYGVPKGPDYRKWRDEVQRELDREAWECELQNRRERERADRYKQLGSFAMAVLLPIVLVLAVASLVR